MMDNSINISNLSQALTNEKQNGFVTVDAKSNTIIQNKGVFASFWHWLTGNENQRLTNIVNAYVNALENVHGKTLENSDTLETLSSQIDNIMKKVKPGREKKLLESSVKRIRAAVHHREPTTLKKKENSFNTYNKLKNWAEAFKNNNKLYKGDVKEINEENKKELTETDEHALEHASQYDQFFALLEKDATLRTAFFKWTIRDGNSAKSFILFPKLADRISASALSPRYGYFHRQYMERKMLAKEKGEELPKHIIKPLEIIKDENGYQVLGNFVDAGDKLSKVKVEPKLFRKNLLDGSATVNMGSDENKLEYKIDDIFESIHGKKRDVVGNFEMFNGAIHNWNSQKFGSVTNQENTKHTSIDFTKDNWWTQMPAFETLSVDEAQDKFGGDEGNLDGVKWGVYAVGARDDVEKVDFGGNHGYKMILIPTEDGQSYNVYPIGTFTKEFPEGGLGLLKFLLNSVEGDLRFDENVYYSHRQKAGALFEMNPKSGMEYMDLIKRKLRMSLGEAPFTGAYEKEVYKNKFVARRVHEIKQYATALLKKLPGNKNKEIDLEPTLRINAESFVNLFQHEILNKKALKEAVKDFVDNISYGPVTLFADQKKDLSKKLEEKIIRDHERMNFNLNQKHYMFQFTDKNCAWNVQEELEEILGKESEGGIVPDLFSLELTKMQPSNFLKYFVKLAGALPGPLGKAVIRTGCRILGAGRSSQYGNKKQKQSVKDTRFWKTAMIYSPAHFMNKVASGLIKPVYKAAVV